MFRQFMVDFLLFIKIMEKLFMHYMTDSIFTSALCFSWFAPNLIDYSGLWSSGLYEFIMMCVYKVEEIGFHTG